jgi:glycosyltransferase involved in cell wall biosynthesis
MAGDAVGGVWHYALDLARGFSAHGIETVLAILGPGPVGSNAREARCIPGLRLVETGLPLDWTARSERELRRVGPELARLAERHAAEIVHLNAPALAAGTRFPAPVVAVAHSCVATWWRAVRQGPLPAEFAWRTRLTRQGLGAADAILTPSNSFARALAEVYGDLPIAVVPNGRRSRPSSVGGKRRCVLTAGRLWDEGKNVAMLDRAAARLDAPVFAAGAVDGPNGAKARFAHLQLLGSLSGAELTRWYGLALVFASMARYEPFGLAVLEAAQAGAALVLSDIPSFRELWDGAASFVDPQDDEALVRRLQQLLDSSARLRSLAARAQRRAARYGVEAMVEGTLAVYRSLLRGRAAPLRKVG